MDSHEVLTRMIPQDLLDRIAELESENRHIIEQLDALVLKWNTKCRQFKEQRDRLIAAIVEADDIFANHPYKAMSIILEALALVEEREDGRMD